MQRKHPLRSRSSDPTPDTAAPPCCCQVGAARAARQQRGCLAGGRPSLGEEEAALRHNRLQAALQSLAVAVAVDTLQVLHHPYPEAAVEVDSHSGLRCRQEGLQIPEVAAVDSLQRPYQVAEAAEDRARRRVPCLAAEEAAGQDLLHRCLVAVVEEEGLGREEGQEEVEARREALLQSLEVAVVAASQDLVEVVAASKA